MNTEDKALIIGIVAVGGYLLYRNYKTTIPERNDVIITPSELTPGASLITYGNTTYKFNPGDWDKLNWAQRFLYGVGISPNWLFS